MSTTNAFQQQKISQDYLMKNKNARSIFDYAVISAKGFAMGVANVIPGVSGGTIAFITGIYEELINSIKSFASTETFKDVLHFKLKKLFKELPWPFLLALGIGVIAAIATAAGIVLTALNQYPEFTIAFFAGLVLASIYFVARKIKKWGLSRISAILAGTAFAYAIVTLIPVSTPNVWWMSLLGGVIFICAMILPGLSGSFLMLVLGQYQFIWGAVNSLKNLELKKEAISTIFFVGVGAVLGLGTFSHFLNWLFKKYHDLTIATLTGFMLGSLWKLWPWQKIMQYSVKLPKEGYKIISADQLTLFENSASKIKPLVSKNILPENLNAQFYITTGLFILGIIIVVLIESIANKQEKKSLAQ